MCSHSLTRSLPQHNEVERTQRHSFGQKINNNSINAKRNAIKKKHVFFCFFSAVGRKHSYRFKTKPLSAGGIPISVCVSFCWNESKIQYVFQMNVFAQQKKNERKREKKKPNEKAISLSNK